jgi:putative N6-adenine-specific DNA methylase
MELTASCLFGMEGLVADELRYMGFDGVEAATGQVCFQGGPAEIVNSNLRLRTAERVMIKLGEFPAKTFDMLFEGVKALPWEDYIEKSGAFPVRGSSLDSALHSVPDCQRIIKKAAAVRLAEHYGLSRLPEDGAGHQIRCSIMRDVACLYLDTSGEGLHKRGWRPNSNLAPLRETLAAAIVKLSRFKGKEIFIDPFCGSGTITIEAALAAINRAPGINRSFAAESWPLCPQKLWSEAREEARAAEFSGGYTILASDIDPACIETAKANAKRAGVDGIVRFKTADALTLPIPEGPGVLAANPPYGERLMTPQEVQKLYSSMGRAWKGLAGWKQYYLTNNPEFEKYFGKRATKRRKLYNGMIQCNLYMYF